MRRLLACLFLIACATPPARPPAAPTFVEDPRFDEVSQRWLDGYLRLSPTTATQVGDHRYDGELDDMSAEGRAARLAQQKQSLLELMALDRRHLSREKQVDAAILENELRGSIWDSEVLATYAWNPLLYNSLAGNGLYLLFARDFAPVEQRLAAATSRMEKLPRLLAQARENLDPARVPLVHAETVAKQNPGIVGIVDELIVPAAASLPAADKARFDAAVAGLRAAVAEHQKWIETVLVPNARGEFRLGAQKYDQKLSFSLSSPLSRAEIRRRAEAELVRVRGEMYVVAQKVLTDRQLPEKPTDEEQQAAIEAALELAYKDRPARDAVVDTAKATLKTATDFVKAKDLVFVPDAPVNIIIMPEFQRGVAVAYCDSPGPLDKGLATQYAISPIPTDWSEEQVDSFLREYNTRMIHLLSIHEAMPGHYLEGAHSNGYPSLLRAVLRSGPFAEGWAVYTEDMMADAGYLDGDPLFRLVQLKFYLRAVANAILDQGVHVDGWTREQAMELMVKKTFQQEREAAGKWVRAQLTSAQLPTYFVGAQEHFDLRKAVQARDGSGFSPRKYHDTVLSFGAPPVRHVRQLMLGEPIQ